MKMRHRHEAMDPNTATSEDTIEEVETQFIRWWQEEVEPKLADVRWPLRVDLREEALDNLKYSLRVAYNRGFTDGI